MFKLNDRFKFTTSDGVYVFRYKDIICLSADSNYTKIQTSDGVYMVSKSMKTVSQGLPDFFQKVHASHIVNFNLVTFLSKREKYLVVGNDKLIVPISRNLYEDVKAILNV